MNGGCGTRPRDSAAERSALSKRRATPEVVVVARPAGGSGNPLNAASTISRNTYNSCSTQEELVKDRLQIPKEMNNKRTHD